jgi:replicative DNA helicase
MCRADLRRVAATLYAALPGRNGAGLLHSLATDDVLWDEVVAITEEGDEETYDMPVPGPMNFVTNDVIVKNSGSLEQDSDVVIFIYRDEVYNPNSEAKGEAEIIIAKQRGGPTGTVRLAWMGQYTTFANLSNAPTGPEGAHY